MNLDHLDDPLGFTPDDQFRAAAQRDGRRRRTRRRLALATGSVLTSMAVLVAALAGYGLWRTSQIDRVDVEFAAPPVSLDEPFNILLIGSDSRSATVVGGSRADTAVVVRVVPAERRVVLMSLPRDLLVEPSTGGGAGVISESFARGGASELVRTVEGRLGIPLAAYAEIDFQGLIAMVDAAGGVPVAVSQGARDEPTGLRLEPTRCTVLDGSTTLALLRARHVEVEQPDGTFLPELSSDLGRQARQVAVLRILVPRLAGVVEGIGGLDRAARLAADHITLDGRLDLPTIVELARWATNGPAPTVDTLLLPLTAVQLDDGRAVFVPGSGAADIVGQLGGELPTGTADDARSTSERPGARDVVVTEVGFVPFGPCP
jgi:LCP family protein required for cell wall assembly